MRKDCNSLWINNNNNGRATTGYYGYRCSWQTTPPPSNRTFLPSTKSFQIRPPSSQLPNCCHYSPVSRSRQRLGQSKHLAMVCFLLSSCAMTILLSVPRGKNEDNLTLRPIITSRCLTSFQSLARFVVRPFQMLGKSLLGALVFVLRCSWPGFGWKTNDL